MSRIVRRSIAHRSNLAPVTTTTSQTLAPIAETSNGQQVVENSLYKQLQELEELEGVIPNLDFICCVVCDSFFDAYCGILVRDCLHPVCIDCIRKVVIECSQVDVKCPHTNCDYFVQDREIRSLLTTLEYEHHNNKYILAEDGYNHNSNNNNNNNNNDKLYEELVKLEEQGVVYNSDVFECVICYNEIEINEGIVMRECLHQYCIDCIRSTINLSEEVIIKCPNVDCDGNLQDREIRSLLTQTDFDKHNLKMLRIAESQAQNSYHCKKANCNGWCIVDDAVNTFVCPCCSSENCLACRAIHAGKNCKEYQDELRYAGMTDCQRTEEHLDEIVRKNEGMRCTTCKIVIMKRTGCDFLVCSMCKTELCWATKMSRWGPGGRGDTSGGCQCMPLKRCHPKCQNCH